MADSSSLLPPQSFRVSRMQSWLNLCFTVRGKKPKKNDDHTIGDAKRTTSSSSRETADELVPGEDFWWDSDVRQRRRHHRPGVSLADRPLGCFASLFLWVLPSFPFPSTRELLSHRLCTRPLPLSGPLLLSLSRARSLTCSLSRSRVAARDISVSLCCTPTTGLDLAVESLRARSQWAQRLEPIFDLHESLYKVYKRGTDSRGSSVSHWIDDTVGKGQLALSREGRLGTSCIFRRLTGYRTQNLLMGDWKIVHIL